LVLDEGQALGQAMTTSFDNRLNFKDSPQESELASRYEAADGVTAGGLALLFLRQERTATRDVIEAHLHEHFEQLIVIRRGSGTVTFDDRQHTFHAPATLIVPSLKVHAYAYEENTERWVVTVAKSYFQELMARTPEFSGVLASGHCIQYLDNEREYVELEHVLGKLDWEQRLSARYREIATEALFVDLLVGVLRKIHASGARNVAENDCYQEVHRRFTQMVEEHHTEHWSLQRFADALRVSIPRLRAVCRSVSGESPIKVINARIVLEAQRCLSYTNLSVSQIAYRLGFDDPAYFSRFFKSRCGQAPSLYKATRNRERGFASSGKAAR
jgi:AraC family transcriptional regulator, transcriptional activator of pobA